MACKSVEEHQPTSAGICAVDRYAEQVHRGPPHAHHRREQIPGLLFAISDEIAEKDERESDLCERAAEYEHRPAENRDAKGHEQHVPEFMDGGIDVTDDRDRSRLVTERRPGEQREHGYE